MKRLGIVFAFGIVLLFRLSAQDKQPELTTKIDPNEGRSKAGVIFDVAEVALTVDEKGVPFSFESSIGLPEYVVEALEQWRFSPFKNNGRSVAFATKVHVPVARPITPAVERSLVPRWYPANDEIKQAIKSGRQLDQSSADALEASLPDAEALGNPRTSLLVYYATEGAKNPEKARAERANLLSWLVEHYPQDDVLGSSFALVNREGDALADAGTSSRLAKLWFDLAKQHLSEERVAEHAVNFLQLADPRNALKLLSMLPRWKNTTAWAADVYGLAAIGVIAISPGTGKAVAATDTPPDGALGTLARDSLLRSSDPKLVLTGLATVIRAGRSLAAAKQLPGIYGDFCPKLLGRARELYPQTSQTCDANQFADDPNREKSESYSESVVHPKLLKRVNPSYPPKAKSKGVYGTVTFSGVVTRSGELAEVYMKSGPLLLASASFDSVRKWRFNPGTVDGKPVDTTSVISVNFALGSPN